MDDPLDPEEQKLAEALRREAEAASPPFSPDLHRRIVAGLGQVGRPRRWQRSALLAAGVLIAIGVGLWLVASPDERVPIASAPAVPSIAHLPEHMVTAVEQAFEGSPAVGDMASLDQDVVRLGRFVLRHVAIAVPGRSATSAAETPG